MLKKTAMYELVPDNGRKSFYGKAKVFENEKGEKTLLSYNTPIAKIAKGKIIRLYDGVVSNTTLIHLKTFCGIQSKKEFAKIAMN